LRGLLTACLAAVLLLPQATLLPALQLLLSQLAKLSVLQMLWADPWRL
jgi:hypothetical protein